MDAEDEEADNLLGRDTSILGVPGFGFGHGERRRSSGGGRGSRKLGVQAMGRTAESQALGLPDFNASSRSGNTGKMVSFDLDTIDDASIEDEVDGMEAPSTEDKKCKKDDVFFDNGVSSGGESGSVDSNVEFNNFILFLDLGEEDTNI